MNYIEVKRYREIGIMATGMLMAIVVSLGIVDSNWILVGFLCVPILIYLALVKPFIFPFGFYALLIPFDNILSMSGSAHGGTMTKYLGAATILALLVKGVHEGRLRKPNSVSLWWSLYVVMAFLSIYWAIQPDRIFLRLPSLIGLFLLYFLCASYRVQQKEFNTLKWFILLGGFLGSVFTIYMAIASGNNWSEIGRVSIEVGERQAGLNQLPFDMLIPLSIYMSMMIESVSKRNRVLLLLIISTVLFSIILTGSRGGILSAGVVFLVYLCFIKKKISFGIVVFALAIILIAFSPEIFINRITGFMEDRGSGRLDIWVVGLKAMSKYLFVGAGFNNFPIAYTEFAYYAPKFLGKAIAPHNIYLGSIVELGILGFLVMIMVMIKHYKIINLRILRNNDENIMLKSAFWAMLVSSFFLDTIWFKSFWMLWILIVMNDNVKRGIALKYDTYRR